MEKTEEKILTSSSTDKLEEMLEIDSIKEVGDLLREKYAHISALSEVFKQSIQKYSNEIDREEKEEFTHLDIILAYINSSLNEFFFLESTYNTINELEKTDRDIDLENFNCIYNDVQSNIFKDIVDSAEDFIEISKEYFVDKTVENQIMIHLMCAKLFLDLSKYNMGKDKENYEENTKVMKAVKDLINEM